MIVVEKVTGAMYVESMFIPGVHVHGVIVA